MTFNFETVISEVTELSKSFLELYKLTVGMKYLVKSSGILNWFGKLDYKNDWLYKEYTTFSTKLSSYVSEEFDISSFVKELNTFIGHYESLYGKTLESVAALNYKIDFDTLEIHESFTNSVHGAKDLVITLKLHVVEEEQRKVEEAAAAKQAEEDDKKAAEEEEVKAKEVEVEAKKERKEKRELLKQKEVEAKGNHGDLVEELKETLEKREKIE